MRIPGSKARPLYILSLALTIGTASAQVRLPVLGDSLSGTISIQQEYEYGRIPVSYAHSRQ